MLNILFAAVGFLLIILLLTEEFRDFLKYLWRQLTVRPGMKYLAYPLAAALFLVAAGFIVFSLWSLFSTKFSYD
jgi:small-conductance mechanosensitive channel